MKGNFHGVEGYLAEEKPRINFVVWLLVFVESFS